MIRKCRGENTHEETAQKQNSADAMWESLEPDLVGKHRGLGEKRGRELIGGQDLTVQKKFLDLGSLPRGDP